MTTLLLLASLALGGEPRMITLAENKSFNKWAYLRDENGEETASWPVEDHHPIFIDWSADGRRMLYQADVEGGYPRSRAFVAEAPFRQGKEVPNTKGIHHPVWSADGKWILFVQDGKSLRAIKPDGAGLKTICSIPSGTLQSAVPSPDGKKLAVMYTPDIVKNHRMTVHVMNADCTGLASLNLPGDYHDVIGWSSKGVLAYQTEIGGREIRFLFPDGTVKTCADKFPGGSWRDDGVFLTSKAEYVNPDDEYPDVRKAHLLAVDPATCAETVLQVKTDGTVFGSPHWRPKPKPAAKTAAKK